MKLIFQILILFLLTNSANCQLSVDFDKVDTSELDKAEIALIQRLSEKILVAQKNGGHYHLTEKEATKEMVDGLNEKVQKNAYNSLKNVFGDYEGLKFESVMKGKKLKIYRFKGFFESKSDVEIRTVINNDGKLAGFFIKPWKEAL